MSQFNITEGSEPFLLVTLEKGESVYCESDAMVMMEPGLEVTGDLRGGVFQSLLRTFTTGESLFQQSIVAKHKAGDCLLAPQMNGDLAILNVGPGSGYCISDGAFVAAESGVELKAKVQSNLGSAFFGQTGGFVIMQANGVGKLCVTGSGDLLALDVDTQGDEEYIIDNGHVVAWENSLQYNIGTVNSGGLVRSLVNTVTSGEGLVFKFRGKGKVVVCSRNMRSLIAKIVEMVKPSTN